jgi:hypothetical protein
MLKRTLILLVLALAQAGCGFEFGEGRYPYDISPLSDKTREELERMKRDLLKIEDLKIGEGPVAAWGRKISADIKVRYADGTVIFQGPIFLYEGSFDPVGGSNLFYNRNYLSTGQDGIRLGLNGMRVGGQRRITIDPRLVCSGFLGDPQPCSLTNMVLDKVWVRRETLVIEATLTEACIPVVLRALYFKGGYLIDRQIRCRNSDTPQVDPQSPLWRFYS